MAAFNEIQDIANQKKDDFMFLNPKYASVSILVPRGNLCYEIEYCPSKLFKQIKKRIYFHSELTAPAYSINRLK